MNAILQHHIAHDQHFIHRQNFRLQIGRWQAAGSLFRIFTISPTQFVELIQLWRRVRLWYFAFWHLPSFVLVGCVVASTGSVAHSWIPKGVQPFLAIPKWAVLCSKSLACFRAWRRSL